MSINVVTCSRLPSDEVLKLHISHLRYVKVFFDYRRLWLTGQCGLHRESKPVFKADRLDPTVFATTCNAYDFQYFHILHCPVMRSTHSINKLGLHIIIIKVI